MDWRRKRTTTQRKQSPVASPLQPSKRFRGYYFLSQERRNISFSHNIFSVDYFLYFPPFFFPYRNACYLKNWGKPHTNLMCCRCAPYLPCSQWDPPIPAADPHPWKTPTAAAPPAGPCPEPANPRGALRVLLGTTPRPYMGFPERPAAARPLLGLSSPSVLFFLWVHLYFSLHSFL